MQGKKILLGITGGIAAYKSAELVRRLREAGAIVRVVMTHAACQFITPLTFQALSGYPVHTDLWDTEAEAAMGHIELARWADLLLVAPASADFIARLRSGMANDLLTTLCLASEAPLYIAPAMNQQMWANVATQENLQVLNQRGVSCIGPASGEQACGEVGPGRMVEVTEILEILAGHFQPQILTGVRLLITAGPTREYLDPVRYLTNLSSGKMGYALAEAAARAGAMVTLISGPSMLPCPGRVKMVSVETTAQMLAAVMDEIETQDIFISAAAVCDYRAEFISPQKMSKQAEHLDLSLVRNPDILRTVTALPQPPFTVGFAAETHQLLHHARQKFKQKKCDLLIANEVGGNTEGGFNSDMNAVVVLWSKGEQVFTLTSKRQLSQQLITFIGQQYAARYSGKNS